MLEQVLTHLRNWFIVPDGIHHGEFTVEGGSIALPFLRDGQYFRIMGSLFNDGLHRYGPEMELLEDETFDGTIWALAIPKAVIRISEEISEWQKKYGDKAASPYISESYAGYTYTKTNGAADSSSGGWQSVFRAQLNPYRKIREV